MRIESAGNGTGRWNETDLANPLRAIAADGVRDLDQDDIDGWGVGCAKDPEVAQKKRIGPAVGARKVF